MQHLLDPIPVEVSPDESALLEEHREVLSAIGLQVEPFGSSTWLVRSIPALLINDDIRVALNELMADLIAGDLPFAANEEAKLITRVCKRAAVKGGQVLSLQEMNELIRHPAILDAVESLLGPDLLCWGAQFFTKQPGDGTFVSWHQDATYWGLSKPEVVTAWIAFTG